MVTRAEVAQAIYGSAWPGEQVDDALPEIRDTFYRMADAAADAFKTSFTDPKGPTP